MEMKTVATKVRTLKKQKLTDLISPDKIHSIVSVNSLFGKSLAITLKSGVNPGLFPKYGEPGSKRGMTYFIALDRFTYHLPYYAAMPVDQYKDIVICHKELIQEDEEGVHSTVFIRTQITKPIKY